MPRTPADLQSFLTASQIAATLIADLGDTPTVPAAAAALGVATDQIIKTLLFLIEAPGELDTPPRPVVVISHGEKRVDKGLLAAYWGVGKKRVNLAPAEVVLSLLGYPAGGVPPFGHSHRPARAGGCCRSSPCASASTASSTPAAATTTPCCN